MDLKIRRFKFAPNDLMKEAIQKPSELRPKKIKNIEQDIFAKRGRIHMPTQDLKTMAFKKQKGLRKRNRERDADASDNANANGSTKKQKS